MVKAKRTWKEIEQTKEYRDAYNGAMEEGLSHTAATAFAKDSTAHLREYQQVEKYPKEIVDCAACGFQFSCSPENPEDLCECPDCKKNNREC